MGRATFGGGGDYSGLFASLYGGASGSGQTDTIRVELDKLEYQYAKGEITAEQFATAYETAAAGYQGTSDSKYYNAMQSAANVRKQTQDATDSDMQSQWQQGMISDDEWKAYVESRAAATQAGDPKAHEKWVKYGRELDNQIGDQKAEFAYENGGSINDLIRYYTQKLQTGRVSADSKEGRESTLRLNDLIDKRVGDDVSAGAQAIVNQINAGKASNADLLKFYKSKLASARPGSDMRKQLQGEVDKATATVAQDAMNARIEKGQYDYERGALSAKGYAALIRKEADGFKVSDPQQYYKMLEGALQIEKQAASAGRASSGSASAARNKSINQQIDGIQANRNYAQDIAKQIENGAKVVYDPTTGQNITVTPAIIKQVDKIIVDSFDQLTAAYTSKGKGFESEAAAAQKSKGAYITDHVTEHNSMAVEDSRHGVLVSINSALAHAEQNPDPEQALAEVAAAARMGNKWLQRVTTTQKTTTLPNAMRFGEASKQTAYTERTGMLALDPEKVSQDAALFQTLAILGDPNTPPEVALQAVAGIEGAFGTDAFGNSKLPKNMRDLVSRAGGLKDNQVSTLSGEKVQYAKDGVIQWADTEKSTLKTLDPMGNAVAIPKLVPKIDLGKNEEFVDVWVDINGEPTKITAVAKIESAFKAWKTTKVVTLGNGTKIPSGSALTADQMAAMEKEGLSLASYAKKEDALWFRSVEVPGGTDERGRQGMSMSFVQDVETGGWFAGDMIPLRNVQTNADGTVQMDSSGHMIATYPAFSDHISVPAPTSSQYPKKVQALVGVPGGIDVSEQKGRDVNGTLVPMSTADFSKSYFDPYKGMDVTSTSPGRKASWWDDQERQNRGHVAQAKALDVLRTNAQRDARKYGEPELAPKGGQKEALGAVAKGLGSILEASGLGQFAKSIGLNLGTPLSKGAGITPTVNKATGFVIPTFSGPSVSAQKPLFLPTATKLATPTIKVPTAAERAKVGVTITGTPLVKPIATPKPVTKKVVAGNVLS